MAKKQNDLKDKLARALADYDNLQKRHQRERQDLEKTANLNLIVRLLPVYDVLTAAQSHLKDPALALALREFEQAFVDNEIEKIEPKKDSRFDEEVHEAVETVKGKKKGLIKEMALVGWKFKSGPVIRPAKVKVVN